MFTKDDYLNYFAQLYAVEEEMEREARFLKKLVTDPEAKQLLAIVEEDEKRHKKIVRDLETLVRANAS